MGSSLAEASKAQVDKRPYRNQTAGWQSAVKLDHLGAQLGTPVAPHGIVWLSDDEATLTARAPADPANNPFLPKTYQFVNNDTGQIEEHDMAPLVLVTDERDVPDEERFVPSSPVAGAVEATIAAGIADTERSLATSADRPVPTQPGGAASPVGASQPVGADPAIQPGHLSGGVAAPTTDDEAPDNGPTGVPATETKVTSAMPGAQSEVAGEEHASQHGDPNASESSGTGKANGGAVEQEEHAAHTAAGEETGAAETPKGDAPEGEYAQHEEVGSPDAPAQGEQS